MKKYEIAVWIDASSIAIPLLIEKNGFKILCFNFYIGKKLHVKIDEWITEAYRE